MPKPKTIFVKSGSAVVKIHPTPWGKYKTWTVVHYEQGRRIRKKFSALSKAKEHAEEKVNALANGTQNVVTITPIDQNAYLRALELIGPTGKPLEIAAGLYAEAYEELACLPSAPSLPEIVRDYARRHPASMPTMTVAAVVDELLTTRTQDGCSKAHLRDLEQRLGKWCSSMPANISDVTGLEIDAWLRGLKREDGKPVSPRTRNNFRGHIANLFAYARQRGYLPRDNHEMEKVPMAKEPAQDIDIFTPAEMRVWLAYAPAKLVPYLVLGAFAGLRTSEVERLTWRDIDLESGWIKIPVASKTGRRVVPAHDNLLAWLTPYRGNGRVHGYKNTANAVTRMVDRVEEAGLEAMWKHNALRHSYASYRLAATGNAARVSEECGHTVRVLRESYRELVTPDQAKEWFGITPATEGTIVKTQFS